jgi:hypothetical protein
MGIAGRVADKAHLDSRGSGWEIDGNFYSNPSAAINMLSGAVMDYKVEEFALARRNVIRFLPAGPVLMATVAGINPLSLGATNLLQVPSGLSLQVMAVFLRCTAASGITSVAAAGVGSGATASTVSDNVYQSQSLTGLNAAGLVWRFPSGGVKVRLTAGQFLNVSIDQVAVGASQTLEAQAYARVYES